MLKKTIIFAAVAGLVLALAPAAQAEEVVTKPGDGYTGDYRLLFTTHGPLHNATSGDIAVYNTFVNDVANNTGGQSGSLLEGLGATWTCIGSTEDVDARDNTNTHPGVDPDYPIYNLRGQRVANDNADLWDGSIGPEFLPVDDGGTFADNSWTGSYNNGVQDPDHPLGSATPRQGIPFGGYPRITYNAGKPNHENWWLYGISTPIPEPATMALFGLGGLGLLLRRKRR